MRFAPGQRWISEPEPELGLGIVLGVEPGRVNLFFPASNAMRLYAEAAAPLRRIRFKVGDTVHAHDGDTFVVTVVNERSDGVVTYGSPTGERLVETQLSDILTWDKPGDRIAGAQVDDNAAFNLRLEALQYQHRILQSPAYGFTGARIDLIPHQLAIARDVAARPHPRVLLADEVGLGKTIEACLILHRLHLTGKAARILILVPEALVHQWFVELFRRFNLRFALFDEARCAAIEENNPGTNPFLDDQLILAPIGWLANNEARGKQAVEAGWNLLVVDEAHHLAWHPDAASPEYTLVEALGNATPGLLPLTATPQQLGPEGHFARLRLLDPDRYSSLEAFQAEAKEYAPIAKLAGKLADEKKLTARDLAKLTAMPGRIGQHAQALAAGDDNARACLLEELVNQHGTGRVLFRNTRAALSGFPKRTAKLIPLEGDAEAARAEFQGEDVPLAQDPRIAWLTAFLKKQKQAKTLLICRTREKAEAVEAALREQTNLPAAVFHEGLTLLQRDRNAASFADEEGVRCLICSEIGSEGRNFQFAHHLVLFDLPENPELLEQRIGRLDRIGQSAAIHIHVPYIEGSPYAVLARWFHEGLNAFEENLHGGAELYERFREPVLALALGCGAEPAPKKRASKTAKTTKKAAKAAKPDAAVSAEALDALIAETQAVHTEIRKRLAAGEDRLLELQNRRAAGAAPLADAIRAADADTTLDDFLLMALDHFGANVEDIAPRTWIVTPGPELGDGLPGIPKEGITLTADRQRALGREDVAFLTWDHPVVRGLFEMFLGTIKGNAAVAQTEGRDAVLVEAIHVLEVVAPAELHVDRFLSATPIRVVVDNHLTEEAAPLGQLAEAPLSKILGKTELCYKLLPKMLDYAASLAEQRAMQVVASSLAAMEGAVGGEVERMRDLAAVNPAVTEKEIEAAQNRLYDLRDHLADARLRLDSVRLIFRS
ncbi:MAG: RNA polymerase-associated protein RapA [Chthoniobacteraceae bacterium]|nr:RNA polymerase-associated protein RapA [Chthoniobacteraceae bacterium]